MKKLLFAALCLLSTTAVHARTLDNIPLVWRPTTEIASEGIIPTSASIAVKGFIDRRANPTLIAENRENERQPKRVTTKDNVAAWCTTHFAEVLQKTGFKVSERGSVTLSAEIVRFFVLETGNYHGEVVVKVTLKSKGGGTLWSGVVTGSASRFGRSYKAENYYETLSDSLIDVLKQLRDDRGFSKAVFRNS